MAITNVLQKLLAVNDSTEQYQIVRGQLKLTGNYGGAATHGDTVTFSNVYGIQSRQIPVHIDIYEAPPAGTLPTGYIFWYCPGTTQNNGVLNIMSGPASEYSQGSAYNAALLGAVIYYEAWFPALL